MYNRIYVGFTESWWMMEINKRKIMGITILSMNNASIYLDEKFKSAKPDDPKYDSSLVISASVLRAITCELCIKAILDNQGLNIKENKYQIHKLDKLFKYVKLDTQNIIIKETQKLFDKNLKKYSKKHLYIDFWKELKEISNIFVKMRYFYEIQLCGNDNILFNYGFLISLQEALCEYIAPII